MIASTDFSLLQLTDDHVQAAPGSTRLGETQPRFNPPAGNLAPDRRRGNTMTTETAHPQPPITPAAPGPIARRLRAIWNGLLAVIGVIVGLAPHVLHHIGLLAGTALIAGAGGTLVFGFIGLFASIPVLLRLRRRFRSWWAPTIGLAVVAIMFALSAFVIGPAIGGTGSQLPGPQPIPSSDHNQHHS
jgi:hypothetical protein